MSSGPQSSRPSLAPGVPPKSGGWQYVIGVLIFAALAAGLFVWKKRSSAEATPQTTVTVKTAEQPQGMRFAPPPPPKIADDVPPEPTASASPSAAPKAAAGGPAGPSPCSKCGEGVAGGALQVEIRSTAQSAQACMRKANKAGNDVSGKLTVSVQVGSAGQVCGASITNDSVGSSEIASCVLGRFKGKTFAPPTSGCVSMAIPISFMTKQ